MPALSDPKFVQSTGGGLVFRENRKPDRETERERERRGSCCDSRHVEEIYSRGRGARIAYADRCAHLRSSFFGAVSSVHEMLDFCFDFRVLEKTCQWAVSNYVRHWRGWKFHSKCLQGTGWSLGRKEGRKEALRIFLPRVFVESWLQVEFSDGRIFK